MKKELLQNLRINITQRARLIKQLKPKLLSRDTDLACYELKEAVTVCHSLLILSVYHSRFKRDYISSKVSASRVLYPCQFYVKCLSPFLSALSL